MVKKPSSRSQGRVLVFGTFDFFHSGHRHFFQQAKKLGTVLIVAVGRDQIVRRIKRRAPHYDERTRLARVAAEPLVHRAILAPRDPRQRFAFIKRLRPHIIALGHDQSTYTTGLQTKLRQQGIRVNVVRLKAWQRHRFRSSLLRQRLSAKKH